MTLSPIYIKTLLINFDDVFEYDKILLINDNPLIAPERQILKEPTLFQVPIQYLNITIPLSFLHTLSAVFWEIVK